MGKRMCGVDFLGEPEKADRSVAMHQLRALWEKGGGGKYIERVSKTFNGTQLITSIDWIADDD